MPQPIVLSFALIGALFFFSSLSISAAEKPNILLVLADDLGYSDLSCYGSEIQTPHIDALAHQGLRFESFYNSARCCPSRASLMTGLYPPQTGIASFTTPKPSPKRGPAFLGRLNEQCVSLAEVLKPAGYQCYYVGKWHLHPETGPIERGFDEFYGFANGYAQDQWDARAYDRLPDDREKEIDPPQGEFYATDVFNQYAVEFIKQGQESKTPWFVFLGHSAPHFPVQAPPEDADRHMETYLRGWDELRQQRFARMQSLGLIDSTRWKLTDLSLVPVDSDDIANGYSGQPNPHWNDLDTERQTDLARRMALFAAMVEHIDQGMGNIVDHLKATQQLDNTLILFLSDNGGCYEWGPYGFDGASRKGITELHTGPALEQMGGFQSNTSYGSAWANLSNTPFRMYKHFTHEGGICTPFIMHWPAVIKDSGTWVRQPGHLVDIMPTLREVAGADYPTTFQDRTLLPEQGQSLFPVLKGQPLEPRSIFFEHNSACAIIKGDWKAVIGKKFPQPESWELYHLSEDRCETHDLAKEHPQRLQDLINEWTDYAIDTGLADKSGKLR